MFEGRSPQVIHILMLFSFSSYFKWKLFLWSVTVCSHLCMLPLHATLLLLHPTSISETFTFPIARCVPVSSPPGGLTRILGVLPSSGHNSLAIESLPGSYRLQPDEAPVTHFGLYPLLLCASCRCLHSCYPQSSQIIKFPVLKGHAGILWQKEEVCILH